jgi:hypothetical protein
MKNSSYTIALILIIVWAFGYFAFNVGGIIHLLLLAAVIAILLKIIRKRKFYSQ